MTSIATISWRRWANQHGFWNLLGWLGRSADQFAGLLLHPLVLVIYARSLESDAARISWFIGVFGVGWAAGYAISPLLQRLTFRVMPWIVGGYIVRAASVLLLAYVVRESSADTEQRFRSALICYGAYAAATGIARSAQARHIVHGSAHGFWDHAVVSTTLATHAVIALGALSLWSVLSEAELRWSQAFGQIWYLATVALGLATLAAVHQGTQAPEVSRSEHRRPSGRAKPNEYRRETWIALIVAVGASAVIFIEGLAFLTVFEDFRRQSIMVRASAGFLAGGWVAGSLISTMARGRYAATLLAQMALGLTMIAILLALSLNDLAAGRWFPETIGGTETVHLGVYAMAALIGAGTAGRRCMLNSVFERIDVGRGMRTALSMAAALVPVVLAYAVRGFQGQTTLGAGLGLCLLVVIALGTLDRSGAGRTPRPAPSTSFESGLAIR